MQLHLGNQRVPPIKLQSYVNIIVIYGHDNAQIDLMYFIFIGHLMIEETYVLVILTVLPFYIGCLI